MPDTKQARTKPELIRFPSDDCEITIGGETYYPHVGESLWFRGKPKIGQTKADWAFRRIGASLDEAAPDPRAEDETDDQFFERIGRSRLTQLALVETHYDDLLQWIATRLDRWDWTDDDGKPLPALDHTTAPLLLLSTDELFYIRNVLSGEAPAEVGNAEGPSPTI